MGYIYLLLNLETTSNALDTRNYIIKLYLSAVEKKHSTKLKMFLFHTSKIEGSLLFFWIRRRRYMSCVLLDEAEG